MQLRWAIIEIQSGFKTSSHPASICQGPLSLSWLADSVQLRRGMSAKALALWAFAMRGSGARPHRHLWVLRDRPLSSLG